MSDIEQIDTPETVIASILRGEYDKDLAIMMNAIINRRKSLAVSAGHMLQAGDTVRFVRGRPRYLIGCEATVVRVLQTWVEVRLKLPIGKFGLGIIRAPMSVIEKVSNE